MKSLSCACIFATALAMAAFGNTATASEVSKLVDTVLYPHDPSPSGVFRWSEGATFSLGDQQRLMMLVTAFGYGGHDFSTANILRFDSYDGGLNWTPLAEAQVFQENIGQSNVMAPSLVRINENKVLSFFNVINSLSDGGPYMKTSLDNGMTWSSPVALPYQGYGASISDSALKLSNGRVLLPAWASFDQLGSDYSYSFYSDNEGVDWSRSAYMTTPAGSSGRPTDPAAEEPTVIELSDSRLMMLMRTYLGTFYKSYSDDFGETWSTPEDSRIVAPGAMPRLSRMPNGDILLLYNTALSEDEIDGPWPRKYLAAAVSSDEGETFHSLQLLEGGSDFPGKITMANVTFFEGNAIITYSRSMNLTNAYDWRLQVIPEAWFIQAPEPSSVAHFATALIALTAYRRRKRKGTYGRALRTRHTSSFVKHYNSEWQTEAGPSARPERNGPVKS